MGTGEQMRAIQTRGLAKKAHSYLQALTDLDRFSGSALVAIDGDVLFSRSYGLANREHEVPNKPQTRFCLASVSKQFTATAIIILQERGALKISDLLAEHMPDCPPAWKDVALRHLLNHTSGIPDYMNFIDWGTATRLPHTPLEVVEPMTRLTPYFQPGEGYSYSNTGYVLLGHIIEQASHVSFAEFLQKNIFGPLGMENTGHEESETVLANRATGYERRGDIYANADFIDMSVAIATGSLYSTTEDLLIWDNALYTKPLVSQDSLAAMTSPAAFIEPYGYGVRLGKEFDRRYIAHSGALSGFRTHYYRFPEDRGCIVALCNTANSGPASAAKDLAAMLFGEKYETPRPRRIISLSPEALERLCGEYQLAPGIVITINRRGSHLAVPLNNRASINLYPESETVFVRKANDDKITFALGDSGKPTGLTLTQSGAEYKAPRLI